jgi:hypothetical protein
MPFTNLRMMQNLWEQLAREEAGPFTTKLETPYRF